MTTEYTLRRADGEDFGSFDQAQSRIREFFPTVEFHWTTSGREKIAIAVARGIAFPPEIMAFLPGLPSLLEGVAVGTGFHVTFGLGHQEPVSCLYVTARGDAPELDRNLAAMAADAGTDFNVSVDE